MQMVSMAFCSEMETEPCCEEHDNPAVEPAAPEVREASSGLADRYSHTELTCGPSEEGVKLQRTEQVETESCATENKNAGIKSPPSDPEKEGGETACNKQRKLKKTNSWKMVRFQDPSADDNVPERDSSAESLFPEYAIEAWTSSAFKELRTAEDWQDITEDRLLRKNVLEPGAPHALRPTWGQEVTVKMQCVLEDLTVVEKDCNLVFVIGEGDVTEPDIPAWAPLLYQLQLLDIREKPDLLTLPIADRIRIGNQKRERGNFHFQREEYSKAARAYCMGLDVLTTSSRDGSDGTVEEEVEEVRDYRVKCLNNLATTQLKLEQNDEALHSSREVLAVDPNNVKALFRMGKLLSDKGEYKEAMEVLKKALKLEPATKAIHVELSKLVKRQSAGKDGQEWKAKPAEILGDNITPFLIPPKKKQYVS
ncbi:hypothetical protein Q8A73_004615 [Channa argus]|nr:hypothetical protein Q8A73_004615 [Channa argus]